MDVVEELRTHCMAKEDSAEDYPWGDVAWKVKGKMFACSSPESSRVSVKSTLEKQAALIQHPNIEPSAYVGRYGWVTVDVVDKSVLELARELIDESYAIVRAGKKKR
ncbi:MAG: MmcQ/YjbR family DNA-binding protein [Fimbriimonas sp.]